MKNLTWLVFAILFIQSDFAQASGFIGVGTGGGGGGGGITSLNGSTAASQTLATGTAGTDFGLLDSGATHTFNLPTASATSRGALSSADWSTFNSKLSSFTETDPLSLHLNGSNSPSAGINWGAQNLSNVLTLTASSVNLGAIAAHFTVPQIITTDATVTPVATLALTDNTVYYLIAKCVSRRTDAADRAVYEKRVTMYREAGGAATLQGTMQSTFEESSDPSWQLAWSPSVNNAVLNFNGAVGKTVDTNCTIEQQKGN